MNIAFHESRLEIVELSENNQRAEKNQFIRNAAVFSDRSIRAEELVFFRVRKNTPNEFKKACLGYTQRNPERMEHDSDLKCIPEFNNGKYLYIHTSSENLQQCEKNWHCLHYSQSGTVFYGVNGVPQGSYQGAKTDRPLWMFITIGSLAEIHIIECPVASKLIESYKRLVHGQAAAFKSVMSTASVLGGPSKMPGMPMRFHKNANETAILNDQQSIEALDVTASVAFSSKSFSEGDCLSMDVANTGSVVLGLTTKNPSDYSASDLTRQFTQDQFGPIRTTVVIGQVHFEASDIVHIAVVRQNGTLLSIIGVNGEAQGSKTLREGRYWMVIRPSTVARITVIECSKAEGEKERDLHAPVAIDVARKPPQIANQGRNVENGADAAKKKAVHFVSDHKEDIRKPENDDPSTSDRSAAEDTKGSSDHSSFTEDGKHYRPGTISVFDKIYSRELTEIRKLGSGAQGDVKLVSTPLLGKMAAKFFNRNSSAAASKYEERELAIMGRLHSHRFIISIHGFIFEKENSPKPLGFLMEVMENGSLHSVIHDVKHVNGKRQFRVKYDKAHIYNWLQQAASAFNFMHGAGVLHRDIKPLNLLLSNDHEQLRVCDLGLSGEVRLEMTMRIGTYIYMAPEVLALASSDSKNSKTYNTQCDVFSLGITLWETIHRRIPYAKDTSQAIVIMKKICKEGYRPVIQQQSSSSLTALVKRAWADRPEDRPTMEEICRFAHDKLMEIEKNSNVSLRIREEPV